MKNISKLSAAVILLFLGLSPIFGQGIENDTIISPERIEKSQELENASEELENASDETEQSTEEVSEELRKERRDEFFGNRGSSYDDGANYNDDEDNFTFNVNIGGNSNTGVGFRVFMFDLGISGYTINDEVNFTEEDDQFNLKYPGSVNVNIHLFRHRMHLIKPAIFFEYGLSVNFKQYKFQNDFRIEPEVTQLNFIDDGVDYKVNKLRTSYLEMPILFTWSPRKNDFKLSLGFYNGLKIGSNQKFKSETNGKEKVKDDFNLRAFTNGFVGRVGFGPIEFYWTIDSKSLFNDGIKDELVPFTAGIALIGF